MTRLHRLRSSREFRNVFRSGRRGSAPLVSCAVSRTAGPELRVGLATARAVGGAVKRNRAKRLLREAIRAASPCVTPGSEVVLIARADLSARSRDEVEASVREALRKAGEPC